MESLEMKKRFSTLSVGIFYTLLVSFMFGTSLIFRLSENHPYYFEFVVIGICAIVSLSALFTYSHIKFVTDIRVDEHKLTYLYLNTKEDIYFKDIVDLVIEEHWIEIKDKTYSSRKFSKWMYDAKIFARFTAVLKEKITSNG